jgi:hypothetical protein
MIDFRDIHRLKGWAVVFIFALALPPTKCCITRVILALKSASPVISPKRP